MSEQTVLPSRKLSGRRSKPSIDLLVDNQRLLSNVSEAKKRKRSTIPKINTSSHLSEKISNISPSKIESDNIDGINDMNSIEPIDNVDRSIHPTVSKTLYVSLEVNEKINDSNKPLSDDPEDDLPLAKVFPNIQDNHEKKKPKIELLLPPKKKIKYVDLSDLSDIDDEVAVVKEAIKPPIQSVDVNIPKKKNIDTYSSNSKSSVKSESKSKSVKSTEIKTKSHHNKPLSPVKPQIPLINVLSMPKIPKKAVIKTVTNGDIPITSCDKQKLQSTNNENQKDKNSSKLESSVVHEDKNESLNQENKIPETVSQIEEAETVKENKLRAKHKHHNNGMNGDSTEESDLRCLRDQCNNYPTTNVQWNNEFCSAECAILYTKQYFKNWLINRNNQELHI